MPDLAVPYAAPMPVLRNLARCTQLFHFQGRRTSEYHRGCDATHPKEGGEFGREIIHQFGHGFAVLGG